MSLDMLGFIDTDFESRPVGGVFHIPARDGDYSGPGGTWQMPEATPFELKLVNIQPLKPKEVQLLAGNITEPSDAKVLHINDGIVLSPDEEGRFSDLFRFSDGLEMRLWRVVQADCRPDRNYCRVVVERFRGSA